MAKKFNQNDWQAMEDAKALATYQEIMADNKRKKAAMKQAKNEVAQLEKRVQSMKRAYGGKLKK